MIREEILQNFKERFKDDILDFHEKSAKRVYVGIKPQALTPMARFLFKELKARFNIASATDLRYNMEILYHFLLEEINLLISLRVTLDKSHLEVESLAPMIEGANWVEREIHELLGINFRGHPELKRLLLSDDWPEGVYPLRRDYKEWDPKAVRDRGL